MSLRAKLAIAMVALAASATVAVGAISYFFTQSELRNQVDASLTQAARQYLATPSIGVPGRPNLGIGPGDDEQPGHPAGNRDDSRTFTQILVQVITADGTVVRSPRSGQLPVGDADLQVADGSSRHQVVRRDGLIDGEPFRLLTAQVEGGAVQFARSLSETEQVLDSIRNRTLVLVACMSALAALIGWFVARQVTRRLVRLTEVASAVAESGDLDVEVPVDGTDETGRLGQAFDRMLSSLARSRRAQHQLVQDAGHELRTPLTSLRTNVSVMHRFDELSPTSRDQLLDDLDTETRELTTLVNELVELATDRRDEEPASRVEVAAMVDAVVDRAHRRSGREIAAECDGSIVVARPSALHRAITNLVENAIKFSDAEVVVRVAGGRLEVLDRGPGIATDDLGRVFDRFYRADAARALPGSGLGLSIVRDVAEAHGGSVFAAPREGGGLSIGLVLPLAPDSKE